MVKELESDKKTTGITASGDIIDEGQVAIENVVQYVINSEFIDRLSKADPKNVQEVAASQIQLLDSYYSLVLEQSRKSFRWALIAAIIGLGFFLASVGFILFRQQETVAIVSLISGSLIEVISGINFYLYGKTSNQLSEFHNRLDLTQRYLLANSVCEGLEGDFKQKARSELVKTIGGLKLTGINE